MSRLRSTHVVHEATREGNAPPVVPEPELSRPAARAAWQAAGLTLGLLLLFMLLWISWYDFNPSSLLRFREAGQTYRPDTIPQGVVVLKDRGYDGHLYYFVAHDLAAQRSGVPLIRYQRVGLPALAWLLGLGQPWGIILVMIGINLLAPVLTVWLAGRWLGRRGISPWWALVFGLAPGAMLSLYFCLAESLMVLLLWLGWMAYDRGQLRMTAVWWALSLLVREAVLPVIGVVLLWELAHRRWRRTALLMLLFIPFVLWQVYLWAQFGRVPMLASAGFLTAPGLGVWHYLQALTPGPITKPWLLNLSTLPIVFLAAALLGYALWKLPGQRRLEWILIGLLTGMLLSLSYEKIWSESITSSGRMLMPVFVFAVAMLPHDQGRWLRGILAAAIGLGMMTALGVWRFPVPAYFVT